MFLTRLPLLLRFVLLLIVFSVPLLVIGGAVQGLRGALAGLVLTDLLVLVLVFRAENILIHAFGATPATDQGLDLTFDSVIHGIEVEWGGFSKMSPPKLFVYPDPLPNSVTIRSVGSAGAVLISRGLLTHLNEAELRSVLRRAILRIEEDEWVFSSLCAAIAVLFSHRVPGQWLSLFFSAEPLPFSRGRFTPFSLIRFLVLYPWIRFSLSLSTWICPADPQDENWMSATRKISSEVRQGGWVRVPAALKLYLVDPTPPMQLIRQA